MHEIKISVDYYFWHDILESLRGVQIRAEIRGEARLRVVPEPATLPALSLGLILLGLVAPQRNVRRGGWRVGGGVTTLLLDENSASTGLSTPTANQESRRTVSLPPFSLPSVKRVRELDNVSSGIQPMKKKLFVAAFVSGLSICTPAGCEPRLIDFTDASAWGGAQGMGIYFHPYGSLTVTLFSGARPLTFNAGGPMGPSYLKRDGHGIGVVDDEITYIPAEQDLLEVRFNQIVTVTSLYFLKFGPNDAALANFGREGPNTFLGFHGNSTGFGAFDGFAVTAVLNHDIAFTANGGGYSLAAIGLDGFRVPKVPEPSALVIAAVGALLASLSTHRQR